MMHRILAQTFDSGALDIPTTTADDSTLRSVLTFVFVLAGAVSVLMVVLGGIRYIISAGDPQKVSAAKNTIIYAVIGLVISLSAFVIVGFIFDATSQTPTSESIGISDSYRTFA